MAKRRPATAGLDPIIVEARERWQRASEAEEAQRTRILAAKEFRAGNQWDPAIKTAREGKNALQGVGAQPPRPCLTIDRLSQPARQISNSIKTANFAIDVVANGSGADDGTAEIIKGYLRRVQNQARGESPVEWAADGAIEGGMGWFRIRTEYVQEAPDEPGVEVFDQELRLERIANNLTVYCDPSANKPTRSDAKFMFVTEDLAKEEFERLYGDEADLRSLEDFSATGDPVCKDWVTKDTVRRAEYWRVTYTTEKWAVLADGSIQQVDEFPKDALQKRTVQRPVIEGRMICATKVLQELPWVGSRIPLIPVLGEELNVDGKALLRGIVEEGMDAQRMVNFMYSAAVENFALMPKTPILAATGAVDAYKDIYQTLNVYNYSWAPWDAFDAQGRQMPEPKLMPRDAGGVSAGVEMMRISEEAIKATTGMFDPSLGKPDSRDRSGRAIQALQGQADLSTSNYGDGVTRALIYAGEQMVEVLPKITRKGQILHTLGLDDEPEQHVVGQPYIPGKKGKPKILSPEEAQQLQEGEAQFFDPTRGRYAVTVTVGKANATKREEGAAALGELIPHLPPEMAAVATPDYVEQLSFPGAHKIAEKLRKALPPGLRDEEEGGEDPEKQAMQQQIQQLQQALEGKHAEEQAKQQAQMQIASMKMQSEERQTAADLEFQRWKIQTEAETKIAVAELGAKVDRLALFLEERARIGTQETDIAHEATQNEHDRQHEAALSALEHQQAIEQASHAAAIAPEPSPNESGGDV